MNDILELAKKIGPKRIAVALPEDEEILLALEQAKNEEIITGILIGAKDKILELAEKNNIDPSGFEIIDEPEGRGACLRCCELVHQNKADLIMKGLVDTKTFMQAILNKEKGLTTGKLISHLAVFEIPNYPKLLMVTDVAINIAPDLFEKAQIIENAVETAHTLGINTPRVGCVAAVEKVDPEKMSATVDAACLSKMADRNQIKGAIVDGPLGLDNIVSEQAAKIKKIESPVAGKADIILAPDIEAGNVIYKSLIEFAKARCAALLAGTQVPVVLTSRSDSHLTKFMSIALGVADCKSV